MKGSDWLVTWHEEGDSEGQGGKIAQVSGSLERLTKARIGKKLRDQKCTWPESY
jgi:hypothetical protein